MLNSVHIQQEFLCLTYPYHKHIMLLMFASILLKTILTFGIFCWLCANIPLFGAY